MTSTAPPSKAGADRWTFAVILASLALVVSYLLRNVLLPFVVAGGLAYVATPSVNWLQRKLGAPRWLAALGPFAVMMGVLALLGYAVRYYVAPQVMHVVADQQAIVEKLFTTLFDGHTLNINGKPFGAHDLAGHVLGLMRVDPSVALPTAMTAFVIFIGATMTIVLLFYFLADGPRLVRGAIWVTPPSLRPRVTLIGRRAAPMIFHYVVGILVIMVYATTLTFLVARFGLKAEQAVLLAILVGALELIPFIGPILSIILIMLLAVDHMTFGRIVGVSLFATGLRLSIDQIVAPLVLGRSVNLPPPVVIFAFMAGGAIWGILGVMVAIPLVGLIKIVLEELYSVSNVTVEEKLHRPRTVA